MIKGALPNIVGLASDSNYDSLSFILNDRVYRLCMASDLKYAFGDMVELELFGTNVGGFSVEWPKDRAEVEEADIYNIEAFGGLEWLVYKN